MNSSHVPDWLIELEILTVRFSHLGIGPDLHSLSMIELWGLYLWLREKL